jgi:SAM-dependent methyltransferase
VPTSAYDAAAAHFDRHRALPEGVTDAIRAAVLASADAVRPRLLDLGAGTGRIGARFVAAGDDYVGVDLSSGMLRAFAQRASDASLPCLVRSDARRLPFRAAAFDVVLLVQVFGGMSGWREVLAEARRVMRRTGAIMTGRTVAPADGLDAQMKRQLAALLDDTKVRGAGMNAREDVQRALEAEARSCTRIVAAAWNAERTPRAFLDRHRHGARFSALPEPAREEALHRLSAWAERSYGSLDTVVAEPHIFELHVYGFGEVVH